MVFKKKVQQEIVKQTQESVNNTPIESTNNIQLDNSEKNTKVLKEIDKYIFNNTEMENYNILNKKIEDRIINIVIPFIMKFVFKIEKGFVFNYKLVSLKNIRIHLKDYLKEICKNNGDLTIEIPLEIFCNTNNDVLYNYLKVKTNYTIN